MDIFTFPHNRAYHPPAPMIEIEVIRVGRPHSFVKLYALVDSGADGTMLPLDVLEQINAQLVGQTNVRSVLGGAQAADVYLVNLRIANISLSGMQVVAIEDTSEALIGRDVLNHLIVTMNGLAQVTEVSR